MNPLQSLFLFSFVLIIIQRLLELRIAKRNTQILLMNGGIEFGKNHYWIIILLHTLFFFSLGLEALVRPLTLSLYWPQLFLIFLFTQFLRFWHIRQMKGRWTTRIIVVPHEKLIKTGLFRLIRHPNYTIVAIEILILPLIFKLYITSLVFSIFNAVILLGIRIPKENYALIECQKKTAFNPVS